VNVYIIYLKFESPFDCIDQIELQGASAMTQEAVDGDHGSKGNSVLSDDDRIPIKSAQSSIAGHIAAASSQSSVSPMAGTVPLGPKEDVEGTSTL